MKDAELKRKIKFLLAQIRARIVLARFSLDGWTSLFKLGDVEVLGVETAFTLPVKPSLYDKLALSGVIDLRRFVLLSPKVPETDTFVKFSSEALRVSRGYFEEAKIKVDEPRALKKWIKSAVPS